MIELDALGVKIPERTVIGLIGEDAAGVSEVLRALSAQGTYFAPDAAPNFANAPLLLINQTLARHDSLVRARAESQLHALSRGGSSVLLASWDEALLSSACDEVWWIENSRIRQRGEPREVLAAWRAYVADRLHAERTGKSAALQPSLRRGDGRGYVRQVELLNASQQPVMAWMSGEPAAIRASVEYMEAVVEPVVGILIRSRLGLHVYGTNTELEGLKLGPRGAGERLRATFAFRCDLCPGEYTVTVASHDPDGTWHEWLDDAVAFSVSDTRYTAGVANLRAAVNWELY